MKPLMIIEAKARKNDLPREACHRAVALLNRQLAATLDLRLRAKQALWNVRGAKTDPLQQLCDQVACAARDAAEVLAKRAVELGGIAEATAQGVARNSRLGAHPPALARAQDQLWAFCGAFVQYTASVRDAIRLADLTGDYDTGDLFILISRSADRLLWRIGATLSETWDGATLPVTLQLKTSGRLASITPGVGRYFPHQTTHLESSIPSRNLHHET